MQYIGIDAGGTKTKFALFDQDGNVLADTTLESCHILQVSDEQAQSIIKQGVDELLTKTDDEVMVVFGLAGYGNNKILRKRIENNCAKAVNVPYIIHNDVEIALSGALGADKGIVIISGTGSIGLSNLHDKMIRCGGWGYLLGDEGSAYWMGKKVLEYFTKIADGRLPRSVLYDLVKQYCNIDDDYALISYISDPNNNTRDKIAKFSLLAYEALKQDDENVKEIYDEAAYEISLIVKALSKDVDKDEIIVSGIGGVFNAKEYLIPLLQKHCGSRYIFRKPLYPPEYGAYLLGKNSKR